MTIANLREQCTLLQHEIADLKKAGGKKTFRDDTNRITWSVDCSGSSEILAEQLEEARCIIRELQEELEETIERNDQEVAILENTIQIVQAEETEKDREIKSLKKIVQNLNTKLDSMELRLDTVENAEHMELLKEHKRRISSRAPERPSESLRYDDDDSSISSVAKEDDSFDLRCSPQSDEQNTSFMKEDKLCWRRRTQQGSSSTVRNNKQNNKKGTAAGWSNNSVSALKSVERLQASRSSIESESFTTIINAKADVTIETTSTLPSSMDSPKRLIAGVDESSPLNRIVAQNEFSYKGAFIECNQQMHSKESTYQSNPTSPAFVEHDEAISSLVKEIKAQDTLIKNLQEQIHSSRAMSEPAITQGRIDSLHKEATVVTAHIMDLQEKINILARHVLDSNQRIAGLEKELQEKKHESAISGENGEEGFMIYNGERLYLDNVDSTLRGELRKRDVQASEMQKTFHENDSHFVKNANEQKSNPITSKKS
jgi:chromosome segregation ATPase